MKIILLKNYETVNHKTERYVLERDLLAELVAL